MELIAKDAGLAGIRFVGDEVMPMAGINIPSLIAAVAGRYGFTKRPTVEDASTTGAVFERGQWQSSVPINITQLGLYQQTMHVTTKDTDDSEVVLFDVITFLQSEFGFRQPTTKLIRAFQSDLIVDFSNDPSGSMKKFSPLLKFIESAIEAQNGEHKVVAVEHLSFGSTTLVPGPRAHFGIERRLEVPWEKNRFFCKAYMRTKAHITALSLLDSILSKKG